MTIEREAAVERERAHVARHDHDAPLHVLRLRKAELLLRLRRLRHLTRAQQQQRLLTRVLEHLVWLQRVKFLLRNKWMPLPLRRGLQFKMMQQ